MPRRPESLVSSNGLPLEQLTVEESARKAPYDLEADTTVIAILFADSAKKEPLPNEWRDPLCGTKP